MPHFPGKGSERPDGADVAATPTPFYDPSRHVTVLGAQGNRLIGERGDAGASQKRWRKRGNRVSLGWHGRFPSGHESAAREHARLKGGHATRKGGHATRKGGHATRKGMHSGDAPRGAHRTSVVPSSPSLCQEITPVLKMLLIAIGGGTGAVLRYLVAGWGQRLGEGSFPIGTMIVNVSGCLLIGLFGAFFAGPTLIREEYRLAVLVGVFGGYTTFSTFGWETFALANDGQFLRAGTNLVLSNLLCLAAVWFGYRVGERWFGV